MNDQDYITFKIDRETPIELDKLTFGMFALGAQYERFIVQNHPEAQDSETDLLVRKITEGSIIIELLGAVQPIFQGMENIRTFMSFIEFFSLKMSALSEPGGRLEKATTKELQEIPHPREPYLTI